MIKRTPWQIQRAVIFAMLMREIKSRFGGHWTGVVWMIGSPLLQVAVLMVVNIYIRGRTGRESYDIAVYLAVALLPFQLCMGLWGRLMGAAAANRGLFAYRQVKPMDALVSRALMDIILGFLVFLLCMVVLARLGYKPALPNQVLAYLGVWLGFSLLGWAMGLFLATIVGKLPRIGMVVSMIQFPLMFSSGALFPLPKVPADIMQWLLLNPLLHLVELARGFYIEGYRPVQGVTPWVPFCYIISLWTLGMCLYWVRRVKIAAGE